MDVNKYADYLISKGIYDDVINHENETLYDNMACICVDLVLSINRKYYDFVVPRVKHFQDTYQDVRTLKEILNLINHIGTENFASVWNYNHLQRVLLLENVVSYLNQLHEKLSKNNYTDNEIEVLRKWAKEVSLKDNEFMRIKGIGVATAQYLRILLGVDTVKPDVHIKSSLNEVYNKKFSDAQAIETIEAVSHILKVNVRSVDKFVWKLRASNSGNEIVWKNNQWE